MDMDSCLISLQLTLDGMTSAYSYEVLFKGTVGASFVSDISIDDIMFYDGTCPGTDELIKLHLFCLISLEDEHISTYTHSFKGIDQWWFQIWNHIQISW